MMVFITIKDSSWESVCFKEYCFNIELAGTKQERANGLAKRDSLDLDSGMLFEFDREGRYSFWMKDVMFPLDIIWISENKEIVFIEERIQPCMEEICAIIQTEEKAKYVLEINAGMADKINLRIGDTVALFK